MRTVFEYTGGRGSGYSIEAMHCYLSRPFKKEINFWGKVLPQKGWIMWLDDVHGTPKWELPKLIETLTSRDVLPDGIYSEKAFTSLARLLISHLEIGGGVSWRKGENGQELVWGKTGSKIVLGHKKGGTIVPSCSLLSTAWTLCRLGYFPTPETACLWGAPLKVVERTETWLRGSDVDAERLVGQLLSVLAPDVTVDVLDIEGS
jgi:hypothetical protein